MQKSFVNIIIGVLSSIIVIGLLIFVIEKDKSLFQMILGFIFFIIPFSFISSFSSKIMSFVLASSTILFGYISYKLGYHDFWIGMVQAFVIGGSIYYFRIRKTSTFSVTDYKIDAQKQRESE